MSERLITLQPRRAIAPETIKAPAWKNIDFTKDGRSFMAKFRHPSEADAKRYSDEWVASCAGDHLRAKNLGLDGVQVIDEHGHHCFFWEEYSHTIQIPWCKP